MLLRCESLEPPMSQLGQPLPSQDFCGTAALPLKPDIARRGWHGRRVPTSLPPFAERDVMEPSVARGLFRLDVRSPDDLAPLLGFVCN
jgi:hypothetical protein